MPVLNKCTMAPLAGSTSALPLLALTAGAEDGGSRIEAVSSLTR